MKAIKLLSGSYRAQVVLGRDEKGKHIVKSFTADTEDDAVLLALMYKSKLGDTKLTKIMTVEQAFTKYIYSRNNVLSPSTIRGYTMIRNTRLKSIMQIVTHAQQTVWNSILNVSHYL